MKVVCLSSIWGSRLGALLAQGIEYVWVDSEDEERIRREIADADVLVSVKFDAAMAGACRKLRFLLCPAAGTELIERAQLPAGAFVRSGAGHEIPIAEYVIGALVALRQRFAMADKALRAGRWEYGFLSSDGLVEELYGSALALVGLGRIAREIVKRAAAFGMEMRAVTMHPERLDAGGVGLESIGDLKDPAQVDDLVAWADALVLCCELSQTTLGLLDARRLGLMKREAVLVNVARGPIAVERDLYLALRDRRIAGAALDVWYKYPKKPGEAARPSAEAFSELENVIMTPHCASWTAAHARRRLEQMARYINGFAATGKVPM